MSDAEEVAVSDSGRAARIGYATVGVAIGCSVLYATVCLGVMIKNWPPQGLDPNEWGDMLAGVFSPLAFFWFLVTVRLQQLDLREQRLAIGQTNRYAAEQAKEAAASARAQADQAQATKDLLLQNVLQLREGRWLVRYTNVLDRMISVWSDLEELRYETTTPQRREFFRQEREFLLAEVGRKHYFIAGTYLAKAANKTLSALREQSISVEAKSCREVAERLYFSLLELNALLWEAHPSSEMKGFLDGFNVVFVRGKMAETLAELEAMCGEATLSDQLARVWHGPNAAVENELHKTR